MTANGLERRVIHGFRLAEAHRDFLCDASEDFSSKSGIFGCDTRRVNELSSWKVKTIKRNA